MEKIVYDEEQEALKKQKKVKQKGSLSNPIDYYPDIQDPK
jgi:hypothetical protein